MNTITVNAATGQPIRTWHHHDDATAAKRIDDAALAWQTWREVDIAERAVRLRACAALLKERREPIARLMAEEMGKPLKQGIAEAEKSAWVCEYYADHAASFLAAEPVDMGMHKSYVACEPLGTVLAIMPWNFPFWQFFRFAAPALMAGNTIVLKHALNTTGCGHAIIELMHDAGFPGSVVVQVVVSDRQVDALIRHPSICGVTITGSTRAGRAVAAAAGSVLKKTVLELGGSDPYLILEDADIEKAADICTTSRLINAGQSCIAAKRFIAVAKVRKSFEEAFIAALKKKIVGDPVAADTDVGPMARSDLRDDLHRQVRESIAAGATCRLGGALPEGPGWFYPVSLLTGVRKGMPAYDEELFGPVAAIIEAHDEEDAIRIANDSRYGLGAAVFTRDAARGEYIARYRLAAGCCFVNDFVKSDPRLPFGGIMDSGYGRELGAAGIREFVNIKSIVVK